MELLRSALFSDAAATLLGGSAALARLAPAVWIAPFLGGRLVPGTVKTGLVLALAILLAPQLVPAARELTGAGAALIAAILVKEVLVGTALGFVVALVFWAAEVAGRLADTARGASMAEILVPQLESRSSPLGALLFQLALVLFLLLGGHRVFLTTLATSYEVLPLARFPALAGWQGLALLSCRLTADLLVLALALAAPVLVALLLADLALGVVNRFVPSVNVFFLAMPLKALVGIGVLALSVGLLASFLPRALDAGLQQVVRALALLGG